METSYPDRFSWFSSIPAGKYWDSTLNKATTTSFHILSNSLFILSYDAIQSELLIALLNKLQIQKLSGEAVA
jgi:hypothetical protein